MLRFKHKKHIYKKNWSPTSKLCLGFMLFFYPKTPGLERGCLWPPNPIVPVSPWRSAHWKYQPNDSKLPRRWPNGGIQKKGWFLFFWVWKFHTNYILKNVYIYNIYMCIVYTEFYLCIHVWFCLRHLRCSWSRCLETEIKILGNIRGFGLDRKLLTSIPRQLEKWCKQNKS